MGYDVMRSLLRSLYVFYKTAVIYRVVSSTDQFMSNVRMFQPHA